MKFIPAVLPAVGLAAGLTMLSACGDDNDDPELPVTDLTLSEWNFSADDYPEVCIGELKTKDDNPEMNATSSNGDFIVNMIYDGRDNGLNEWKVMLSIPRNAALSARDTDIEVEVVGKTDERIYKKARISQYGKVSDLTFPALEGSYTLVSYSELDDDGSVSPAKNCSLSLEIAADGKVNVSDQKGIDDFVPGNYNAVLNGNRLTLGTRTYTVAALNNQNGTKTLVLEEIDYDNGNIDDIEQFTLRAN